MDVVVVLLLVVVKTASSSSSLRRESASHESRTDSRKGEWLPPVLLLTVVAVKVGDDDSSRAARWSLSVSGCCSLLSGMQSRLSGFGSMGKSREKGDDSAGLSSLECDGAGEYTCGGWSTW